MRTQWDTKIRVVAMSNLEVMLDSICGVSHQYWVESVSAHRVVIGYSNPDEYGSDYPVYVTLPAFEDKDLGGTFVLFHVLRVKGGHKDDYDPIQFFDPLFDHPELFRPNADSNDWRTREEWEKEQAV